MKKRNLPLFFIAAVVLCCACKKEISPSGYRTSMVSSADTSLFSTDGTITVQTAILPPNTPQTFITSGNSSIAEFDIIASKRILIYQLFFSATYPQIISININGFGIQPNAGGTITFNGVGQYIEAGRGLALITTPFYVDIDKSVSGKAAHLKLTRIIYRTDDEVYHDFSPGNAGRAQAVCLVNNIPKILFQDPLGRTLPNGFKELADIKLMGDTGYVINHLPLHLSSPLTGFIPNSSYIVRYKGKTVGRTDSVQLNPGYVAETVIHFEEGFKHEPGADDLLKVFAPVSSDHDVVLTSMSSTGIFEWKDDLDVLIPAVKNIRFFKQETGQASFH